MLRLITENLLNAVNEQHPSSTFDLSVEIQYLFCPIIDLGSKHKLGGHPDACLVLQNVWKYVVVLGSDQKLLIGSFILLETESMT